MPVKKTVKITEIPGAFARLAAPGGATDQAVAKAAGRARDRAKQNLTDAGRVDTGGLRQSIMTRRISGNRDQIVYEVGTDVPHGRYNEVGTGIFGPRGAMIFPKRAKVLRFAPNANTPDGAVSKDGFVYTTAVRGMEGVYFLTRAAKSIKPADFVG